MGAGDSQRQINVGMGLHCFEDWPLKAVFRSNPGDGQNAAGRSFAIGAIGNSSETVYDIIPHLPTHSVALCT